MMYQDGGVIRSEQSDLFNTQYFSQAEQSNVLKVVPMDAQGQSNASYRLARQSPESVFNSDGATPYGPDNKGVVQYDMHQDFITQVIYQLNCSLDMPFAAEVLPLLKRHLAWQERCFHRDGLYENFANFWASDSVQYAGAGCALATANNYLAYAAAAQLSELLGENPAPYRKKCRQLRRALRTQLWLDAQGYPAESRDTLGEKLVHPLSSLPTIVTCITSGILTEEECLSSLDYVKRSLEHIRLPDGELVYNSQWAPYRWSIRDVDFADVCHLALCCFPLNRAEDGWQYLRGVIGESCMRNVAPGTFMCVLEGKSVDFSDTTSIIARTIAEGLFGYRPRLLEGRILLAPAIPAALPELSWKLPGAQGAWHRRADMLQFSWQVDRQDCPVVVQLPLHRETITQMKVNGAVTNDYQLVRKGGWLCLLLHAGSTGCVEVSLAGEDACCTIPTFRPAETPPPAQSRSFPVGPWMPLDMRQHFNSRICDLFARPYLSPRPTTCSLQLPCSLLPPTWCLRADAPAVPSPGIQLSDEPLRQAVHEGIFTACGIPFHQISAPDDDNALFVSQWDNFPTSVQIPLNIPAGDLALLLTGYTNHMQCGVPNARLRFIHADGTETCYVLTAPVNFRSLEAGPESERPQDRSCYQIDLPRAVIGRFSGEVSGNAYAQVNAFHLPADAIALRVEAIANEIVLGVMGISILKPCDQ